VEGRGRATDDPRWAYLFKANGVQWIRGTGTFTGAHTLTVDGQDVSFTSAIIATGSYPVRPPVPGLDSDRCVDSEQLLAPTEVPGRLIILGGGVIGCEFASIFGRFGSEVTIIEMPPSLIPQEDADAASSPSSSASAASQCISASAAPRSKTPDRSSPSISATARPPGRT
jgi:dihydrolipoamide dehydrogenase